ncbi:MULTISPECIES: photosynthetic complex putative assembly protein PuhB [Rhodopseudomonas]|uniref:Phosphopantetheine adenylyltransferase n=1 Tax=Rhodopseudomonas palustris TaxID=1076 RepID=A0A0D7EDY9_RHOPL|nr:MULTISPECIES: photosynthetic complex putative assembly protein PuhB [Rhodopseudomonas]KIZ38963.1 phosphopantetheine adenylyltransferase [Rhodopseudomonas palustris]MDF3813362.1 photosynthetic complex putative assembly protein PuhB [Rhodopseudomonas sp. BAL398]WOK20374.1 photosynthetic complex putative assembly protein PuhB [Rhodopseudomonas sp. BAL398]
MTRTPSQFRELPSPLPEGERVIWQGKPTYKGLAFRSFHIREALIYLVLLMSWKGWSNWSSGQSISEAAASMLAPLLLTLGGIALLAMLAWLFRRATCYTITDKRILLQSGVALPVTMNIPLGKIGNAALKTRSDGSGDIPLQLIDTDRVSMVLLWPHIRPWRLQRPEPMLMSVPDAAEVAAKLADALKGRHDSSAVSLVKPASGGPANGPLSSSTTVAA